MPCPLCGGLIHPVAGRCKHCKEDLTSFRAGRPAAATPLPALHGAAASAATGPVATPVGAVGAVPIAVPAREASQPILPPRPTGRSISAQRPRASLLRNWPVIVIILAVIAIVGAVVIMVLPSDRKSDNGKRQLMPTPAPDRMETNPLPPKSSQVDPWGSPGGSPADPRAVPTPPPPPPDPDPAPVDPDDLYGGLGGGLGGGSSMGAFAITLAHAACKKLQGCPGADTAMLGPLCDQLAALPQPPMPASCAPAQRCLDAIQRLDCDAGLTNNHPLYTVYQLQDCMKAVSDC